MKEYFRRNRRLIQIRNAVCAPLLSALLLLGCAGCGLADPFVSPGPATAPVTTAAPGGTAPAPQSTAAPAPEEAPPAQTAAPAAETQAPAEETQAPAAETPNPETVSSPTDISTAAPEETPAPAETAAPASETAVPVASTLTQVTLLQPVWAYTKADGERVSLPAGSKVSVASAEDEGWMTCDLGDGKDPLLLRLDPENPYLIDTPEGYLYLWVVLDGLDFT